MDLNNNDNNNNDNNNENKPRTEKKKKSVHWDWKALEENELEAKLHPVTKPVTEPKTPYTPYEEGDDEYFNKLNEVNAIKNEEDILNNVNKDLEKIENLSKNKFIEVEVFESDGKVKKEYVDNKGEKKEFKDKRKKAYHNEFAEAKKFFDEHIKNEEDDDNISKEKLKTIMDNTLKNKFIGNKLNNDNEKNDNNNNNNEK